MAFHIGGYSQLLTLEIDRIQVNQTDPQSPLAYHLSGKNNVVIMNVSVCMYGRYVCKYGLKCCSKVLNHFEMSLFSNGKLLLK